MKALMVVLVVFVLAVSALAQGVHAFVVVTGTGYIAHEKCVKNGSDPAKCSDQCPKAGNTLVMVTEKGAATKIENPDKARKYLGQKVNVSGKFSNNEIHLDSITPAR